MRASPISLIHERIDRENELLGHRTGWVVASQSFLLSVYANALIGSAHEPAGRNGRRLELLLTILPWAGIASLLALCSAAWAALETMRRLRQTMRASHPAVELAPRPLLLVGLAGSVVVPAVFLVAWVALLVRVP